jgi:uncharacterized membrane protein required for colicin V production
MIMLWVNLLLLALLASFVGAGGKRGLIDSVGRLIGAVLGFWVARFFSGPLGTLFSRLGIGGEQTVHFIAFLVLFFVVFALIAWVIGLAAKMMRLVTRLPIISWADSLLGGAVGLVEGVVFLGSALVLVFSTMASPKLAELLAPSWVARLIEKSFSFMLGFLM